MRLVHTRRKRAGSPTTRGSVFISHDYFSSFCFIAQLADHLSCQSIGIHLFPLHFDAARAGKAEKIIYQPAHLIGRAGNDVEIVLAFFIQVLPVLLFSISTNPFMCLSGARRS